MPDHNCLGSYFTPSNPTLHSWNPSLHPSTTASDPRLSTTTASDLSFGAMRACVRREGSRCEKTEEDTEQPIAAPAWQFYGTRPSLRDLCVLRTVRAAGRGFRAGTGHSAGRCTLGRLFGLRDAARPRTWWYAIVHGIRDKVRITNSWQSSRTCPVLMLLVLCTGWNFDAGRQISRDFGGETMHVMHES